MRVSYIINPNNIIVVVVLLKLFELIRFAGAPFYVGDFYCRNKALTAPCKLLHVHDFTAAGVVPCGGRKTSPRTSTIVQFIFCFGPLRSAIIF